MSLGNDTLTEVRSLYQKAADLKKELKATEDRIAAVLGCDGAVGKTGRNAVSSRQRRAFFGALIKEEQKRERIETQR